MRDELAARLARHARERGLNQSTLEDADEVTVREFCAMVLNEVAARGWLESDAQVGCHAARREGGN